MNNDNRYFRLLKRWVDRLITLQCPPTMERYFRGGFMCPACAKIHGRSGDAVLPLLYVAKVTGDRKYIESAKELFDWSEFNIVRADDSYVNDSNNDWRGITVFSVISLAETLSLFGDLLDGKTREKWMDRLGRSAECLYHLIDTLNPNVNYPISTAAALAICAKLLDCRKYSEKAHRMMHEMLSFINDDGLIFGEGNPSLLETEKGCQGIDIGYNVEESLVAMALYSINTGDQDVRQAVIRCLYAHLPFFIPDGGWNNSWGSRNAKWSYWGSRTSDGCQLCYGLFDDVDPVFGEVAYRNFLMYEKCTDDSLLLGGPMFADEGEPACVHHTFCHSKGLALMLAMGHCPEGGLGLELDDETVTRTYQRGNLVMVAAKDWKASISTVDYPYCQGSNSGGGCMTFLWNRGFGPILAATMVKYSLHEPANMQIPKVYPFECDSMRIVLSDGCNEEINNINDGLATLEHEEKDGVTRVRVSGNMADLDGKRTSATFELNYELCSDGVTIRACCAEDSTLKLPVVSRNGLFNADANSITVIGDDSCDLIVESDAESSIDVLGPGRSRTAFNPVGGFRYMPVEYRLKANEIVEVRISVRNK